MSDLKSCGWSTLYRMKGLQVSLPEELTPKWWDKNKQLLAKTHATGVGAELKKLQDKFDAINWVFLSANPNAMKLDVEAGKKLINSSEVTGFITQLRVVRDLAKSESAVMKKSALTRKTGDVLLKMSTTADLVSVACNGNSLSGALSDAIKEWNQVIKAKFIQLAQPTLVAVEKVNKKLPTEESNIMAALKKQLGSPSAVNSAALGNLIRDLCRDMTQPLGNLMKSAKSEVPFSNYDGPKIETLYKSLVGIADSKSEADFMNKLDANGMVSLVNDVKKWTKSFNTLTKDITIA